MNEETMQFEDAPFVYQVGPCWYAKVQNNGEFDIDTKYVWVHVSDSVDYNVTQVRYGYPIDKTDNDDAWEDVEASLSCPDFEEKEE